MSNVSTLLTTLVEQEKKAHYEYIRDFSASTIAHLVHGGVDKEMATNLTKQACQLEPTIAQDSQRVFVLEKVAAYVAELEAKMADLEKQVEAKPAPVEKRAEISALERIGFTKEEIDAIESISPEAITKIASATSSSESYGLGSAVGMERPRTDPLLDWILS